MPMERLKKKGKKTLKLEPRNKALMDEQMDG